MTDLQVYTLGRMAIQRDGETLTGFVSQKTVLLFVYLRLHPREHPRDILAQTFWAETTDEQALKNFRTILSNLQKQLGDYLTVTRESVALHTPGAVWCDVDALETALNLLDIQTPQSPRRLAESLMTAATLYQGEFLAGVKTDGAPQLDQWMMLERERLQNRFTAGLFRLVELEAARGDYSTALTYGQRLLTLDPYWEEAYRLQLSILAAAGSRHAALQLYESLCKRLRDDLDAEPEADTVRLVTEIRAGRLRPKYRAPANTIPARNERYIPVPAIVEAVQTRLDAPQCRLLTLLGIGGMGKTSLARHIANLRQEEYQDGVFFVALESLTGHEFIPQAVSAALRLSEADETRQLSLMAYLRDKHLLLILDNFEHVTAAAGWVAEVLAECPHVQILVTSREQLNLAQEHIVHINGLPIDGETTPAIQLFAATARQFNPSFDLAQNLATVTRICQLVDGLPLGILIAAGWIQFLTPAQIVERIETSLDFLTMSRRDLPDRHQGVNALLTPVWETLSAAERDSLLLLSIFPGHFDLEDAAHVTGADLPALAVLSSKSLLSTDGLGRYQLHELLRRFIYQKAAESGRIEAARRAHHTYYSRWIDDLYEARLASHEQFAFIDMEYHNLWYFDWLPLDEQYQHILRLAKILPDYWIARDIHLKEGIELLRQALPEATGWSRANACVRFGRLLAQFGEFREARTVLEEGLALSRQREDLMLESLALSELKRVVSELGDQELAREYLLEIIQLYETTNVKDMVALREIFSRAYSNLAVVYLQMGKLEDAERYGLIGLQKHREAGDRIAEALGRNTLGIIALDRGDYALAREHFDAGLGIVNTIGHKRYQTMLSGNLAESMHRAGDCLGALHKYCETFTRAANINNRKTMLNVLEQLSNVLLDLDEPERAAQYLGAALALREALGLAIQSRQEAEFAHREARLRAALGAQQMQTALEIGRALNLDDLAARISSEILSPIEG